MFVGPIFSREALTAPRTVKHYFVRSGYVAVLLVLMYTASQATFGMQQVRSIGDVARFGKFVFDVLAVVQLSVVIATALLFGSGNVAQEKDRRTLILLLMTDLRNRELVLGKLFAGLLAVGVMIGASLPVFCFIRLLGGVTLEQVLWLEALCVAAAFAAGAWGSLVAFWREKTFQTLAISVLGAVLFIGIAEAVRLLAGPDALVGRIAGLGNPYGSLMKILDPLGRQSGVGAPGVAVMDAVLALTVLGGALASYTLFMVRRWNPSKSLHQHALAKETAVRERRQSRPVWNSPIVWREICTRAYGRRIIFIKLAYFVLAAFIILSLVAGEQEGGRMLGMIAGEGFAFVALTLVTLILVNAQSVTSLTTERDGQTLELLLVTDVTAKEFIFGKLGGILYNTKELIAAPFLLLVYLRFNGQMTLEDFTYVFFGYVTLVLFAAMLGLHSGLTYDNSRTAIANSLGTMFFLFVGIFVCMMLMVEARASYEMQLIPFLVFILGGALGLWASLTHKNPSSAFVVASGVLPFCTFYAVTSYLLGYTLGVFLCVVAAYGFTAFAMLVPAVSEFDVALGRTTLDRG